MPHSELFGSRLNVSFKDFVKPFCRFFSFFFLNLSLQTTCCCVLISWTATCFKGLLELSRDGDRRQRLTPWKDALQLPDWQDRGVEQIQRDSQSESVDFPDCLSHYRLLTTSPWLSLAVSFSHIFQRQPWKKKKKGCWAVQTALSFKICPCAISLSSSCLWKTFSVFPCPLRSRQTAPHSFSSHCQVISERRRTETALKHTVRYISSFVFHATLRCCCFM